MRQHSEFLTKRDHLLYRSYYRLVQDIVDFDLCEAAVNLSSDKLKTVAKALSMTPADVLRRVEELKEKVMTL